MSRAPGSYAGLTVTQANLLSFLREREAAEHTPSFEEMKEHLGLKSKSGVHRLLSALNERGYIVRHYNRARAITCVNPDDANPATMPTSRLIAALELRGFNFYGMSGELA